MPDISSPIPSEDYTFDHDTLEIPWWLKIPGDVRKANWSDVKPVTVQSAPRQATLADRVAASRAEDRKAKNAKGFARMMEKHPNERYDRKKRAWVPK